MTDRDKGLQELALKYEEKTNIKIKIDLYAPSEQYSQRVIAAAQAQVLPDIYGILDKKDIFATFIQSGFVEDLTPWFQAGNNDWQNSFFDKALDVNRFSENNLSGIKPGIYGVPIDVTNIQMVYNKKLLLKAGIKEPPQTFDDFITAIKALNRVGIPGLVSGWGEMWMVDSFALNYAFNIMGEEKVMATFQGDVPYTDPDWIAVFDIFKKLRESSALAEGIVTKPNKEAEQDFALERAAFAFNGSWCVNIYKGMNPQLQYGVMLPPKLNLEKPMKIWGGAGSSFVVNPASKQKDKAVEFLKWLTMEEQQVYFTQATNNLPANRNALTNVNEALIDFANAMDNVTHPRVWQHNELPVVSEKFDKGIQSIIIGEKTPEEVAKEVQSFKVQEMQKVKNRKR